MAIRLSKDDRERARASVQRFFEEQMEEPLGNLKTDLLLAFFLAELAPTVYNRAVVDAQTYFQEKTADLDGSCHEPEFTFWDRDRSGRRVDRKPQR